MSAFYLTEQFTSDGLLTWPVYYQTEQAALSRAIQTKEPISLTRIEFRDSPAHGVTHRQTYTPDEAVELLQSLPEPSL